MFGRFTPETHNLESVPDSFKEPTDGSIRYRPWGAMPANPFADEALKLRQLIIDTEFQKIFDNPPEGTPKNFAKMLSEDHLVGEQRRKMKNFEGYSAWMERHEPVDEELDKKIEHVVYGNALIGEILDYALETSVENVEVGKVMHGYGKRLEYVTPFRREAEAAIEEKGGTVFPKVFPYRSLSIVPHIDDEDHTLSGFIIRYKRDFGQIPLPDGSGMLHVVERQIAGIRVDAASGFSQVVMDMFEMNHQEGVDPWLNAEGHIRDSGCEGFIMRAVQSDSRADFMVPISTTIYAYKEIYNEESHAKFLAQQALKYAVPVEDDGIAYFGPEHTILKMK